MKNEERHERWRRLLRGGGIVHESTEAPTNSKSSQKRASYHVTRRCTRVRDAAGVSLMECYTAGHDKAVVNSKLCDACAGGFWKRTMYRACSKAQRLGRIRFWVTASALAWPVFLVSAWLQPSAFDMSTNSRFTTAVIQGIVIAFTIKWCSLIIKEWRRLRGLALVERISWKYMGMICSEDDFGFNSIGIPVNAVKIKIVEALIADMKVVQKTCAIHFSQDEMIQCETLVVDIERWMESMNEGAERAALLNPKIFRTAVASFVNFSMNKRKSSGFGHMSMGMPGGRIWVGSQAARDARVI